MQLLHDHLEQMRLNSPPGTVFAFEPERLHASDVTFWSMRDGDVLMGCCALRQLDAAHGEIKSMRTHPEHLRQGVARLLLDHLVAVAQARKYRRLSLETGSGDPFIPVLALYRGAGFSEGDAFADYQPSPFNRFFHLEL